MVITRGKPKKLPFQAPRPQDVDVAVNALFSALTSDLGRPFVAGSRNVRSIVQDWCPLTSGYSPLDEKDFLCSYGPAHFFDRYFYADELEVSESLKVAAREKFLANIALGVDMNLKIALLPWSSNHRLQRVLWSANRLCSGVLLDFDIEEIFSMCGHGPNSTIGVRKAEAYLDRKALSLDGTEKALDIFLGAYLDWDETLSEFLAHTGKDPYDAIDVDQLARDIRVLQGNKLDFVPKSYKSLRTMSVEGTVNQFFQLGTGRVIAKRLKSAGICLATQPECHRKLARLGSLSAGDAIATIDWSQASDRIWLELCRAILPPDWFKWISDVRSPATIWNEDLIPLPMAGTMGAGFTFPLQTLIFWTLLVATAEEFGACRFVSVFGDDCIVDPSLEEGVDWLAAELGWTLNKDKSHFFGGFRESCGMDAWRGMACRPYYMERPASVATRGDCLAWIHACINGLQKAYGHAFALTACYNWAVMTAKSWDVGQVLVVPQDYPDTSGVQTMSPIRTDFPPSFSHPEPKIGVPGWYTLRGLPDTEREEAASRLLADYNICWKFRALLSQPVGDVPVEQEFYYWYALKGLPVPKNWNESLSASHLDDGIESIRVNGVEHKLQRVLTQDSVGYGVQSDGTVPARVTRYRRTNDYRYTW